MPRFRLFLFLVAIPVFSLSTLAQQQVTPPKLQTARQALVEMITKGQDAITKHLTVEVQDLLKSGGKPSSFGFAALSSMKPENGLQTFDSGEILFAYTDSAQNTKYEVHVDNDDLAGNEDSILLSIHAFRDGKEQDEEWGLMSSHFTVSMKLQQNIWRVDKISVGAEFPVGDPKFIAKTFLNPSSGKSTGLSATAGGHSTLAAAEVAAATMPPEQAVRMLAFAETAFARLHPDTGFSCSLSELAETSKIMGVDPQVATGTYNGYRFALAGCEGKPAASFQITAEPLLAAPGVEAFCTDATQNLRADDNGHGATCLATGKMYQALEDTPAAFGLDVHVHAPETSPKP